MHLCDMTTDKCLTHGAGFLMQCLRLETGEAAGLLRTIKKLMLAWHCYE